MNDTTTPALSKKRAFIGEFEGLRGILAAWVVFGHILLFSGFTYDDGWFGIIFSPVLGVYAFMMLSGFVIVAALDQRPTSWLTFMSRRFFRLFPVYLLCLALAIVLFNMSVNLAQTTTLSAFGPENLERLHDVEQNFGVYLLADSTLLQCLLPRQWFLFAHESFLPPTWSLSIEWLFYMVAPMIVLLFKRSRNIGIGAILATIVTVFFFESWLTEVVNRSFHTGNLFHFLTGMGSYLVWKHLPVRQDCWKTKLAFWSTILVGIAMLSLPYKIWIATFAMILYPRIHANPLFFMEWPRQFLMSKPLQFLGRTSYVTYLLHWIVIEMVMFWISQFAPGISNRLVLATICTLVAYPLTYLASSVIHQHLEVPMMRLAKRRKQNCEPKVATTG